VIGTPVAFWGNGFASTLIQGLHKRSFLSIGFVAATVIAIALFAAYVPSHRAAPFGSLEALRHE